MGVIEFGVGVTHSGVRVASPGLGLLVVGMALHFEIQASGGPELFTNGLELCVERFGLNISWS